MDRDEFLQRVERIEAYLTVRYEIHPSSSAQVWKRRVAVTLTAVALGIDDEQLEQWGLVGLSGPDC